LPDQEDIMAIDPQCRICLANISSPQGFLLTTTQVVGSPGYWEQYCQRHAAELANQGIASPAELAQAPQRFAIAHPIAQEGGPWLICDQCIPLFAVDREQAHRDAETWWASDGSFVPPGSGAAPLSAVRMAGQPVGELPAGFQPPAPIPQPSSPALPAEPAALAESVPAPDQPDDTHPTPAPTKGRPAVPGSGSRIQAAGSALLNLTGLGLGEFYLKLWRLGVIFLAGTLAIIAGGFLLHAAKAPALFLGLIAAWLVAATIVGALNGFSRQARPRPWLPFVIAGGALLVEGAVVAGYFLAGSATINTAQNNYASGNCRTALPLYQTYTRVFELTFSPDFALASVKIQECSLLVHGEDSRSSGDMAEAIQAYDRYLTLFPKTPFSGTVAGLEPVIYTEWAQNLRKSGDYASALEKYDASAEVAVTLGIEKPAKMTEAKAQTLLEWGDSLNKSGDPAAALAKYTQVMQDYKGTSANAAALTRAGETLLAWGDQLRSNGDLAGALSKYQAVIDTYPTSSSAPTALTRAGETLRRHGDELRLAGDFGGAVENYLAVLDKYPQSESARGLTDLLPEVYVAWGDQLRQKADFGSALEKYQIVLDTYSQSTAAGGLPNVLPAVYVSWGDKLVENGSVSDGLDKYKQVLKDYPNYPDKTSLNAKAGDAALKLAAQLHTAGDAGAAVALYQEILSSYAGTSAAAQAKTEMAGALFDWANQLVAQKEYAKALEQIAILQKDYAATEAAKKASTASEGVYIAWGKDLFSHKEYYAAIDKYEQVRKVTSDDGVKDDANQAWTDAVTALASDTGVQGQMAVDGAKATACSFRPAASPAIAFIPTGPATAYACDSELELPAGLLPTDPGHFRYAVKLTYESVNIESCPYMEGHTLIRRQQNVLIKVINTLSGGIFTSKTLTGSMPATCPPSHGFYESIAYEDGTTPSSSQINEWLVTVLK
jgi:tetratricopeptide (TPR) repeat protein